MIKESSKSKTSSPTRSQSKASGSSVSKTLFPTQSQLKDSSSSVVKTPSPTWSQSKANNSNTIEEMSTTENNTHWSSPREKTPERSYHKVAEDKINGLPSP